MSSPALQFKHTVIDPEPAGSENDILLIGDVDGDGNNDIVVGGKFAPGPGRRPAEGNLVWYEGPNWTRHVIGAGELEAGGLLADLTGDGRFDVVAGQQHGGRHLYWWENPPDPRRRWTMRTITDRFEKYHDQAIGDVDGDGRDELVVLTQGERKVLYFDIPEDPRVEPWPQSGCHLICDDVIVEGATVVDLDADGDMEIVAGANIFKHRGDPTQPWDRRVLIDDFEPARVAIADLRGTGGLDLILSEGETHPGRLVWLEGPDYVRVHELHGELFNPHSLAVADFTGDGRPDIFVGEMHLGRNASPKLYVYVNRGGGAFEPVTIDCPQGTHEAKVGMLPGRTCPSIIGKPYLPHSQVDVWDVA